MADASAAAWNNPDTSLNPHLLTTEQAAGYLGVSVRTVKSLMAGGHLHYVKIGRATRFQTGDLESFVAQHRRKQRNPRRRVS